MTPAAPLKKVITAGEILVEIMADTPGTGFCAPMALAGPFPSGAPAIFIDQVARTGQPCGIIGCVGEDDFGRLNIDRLRADGVDVSAIGTDPDRPTGSAFVRYRPDGSRDFVYNIRHSAAGRLPHGPQVAALVGSADHLHVTGSSLSSPDILDFNLRTAEAIKRRGGTVSFDPNLRKEMLGGAEVVSGMRRILAMTDLFLPSGDEIMLLTSADTPEGALREILSGGVGAVVHKLGRDGARYHGPGGSAFVPAFPVRQVDPTGAGDCFGGVFTALWLRGAGPEDALRLAAAAGAQAVSRRGPMEGATDLAGLREFVRSNQRNAP